MYAPTVEKKSKTITKQTYRGALDGARPPKVKRQSKMTTG